MTFEQAKAAYVHRFTMEHVPQWAKEPFDNGKYPAPQFRTDKEWFDNTLFPPHKYSRSKRDTSCYTSNESWPIGKALSAPFVVNGHRFDPLIDGCICGVKDCKMLGLVFPSHPPNLETA